jgi:hypothetical protein
VTPTFGPWNTFSVSREWGVTPRQSILAACERNGTSYVVEGCIAILEGDIDDPQLIVVLGGPHGENVLADYDDGLDGYWPAVWAARGLLHVWDDAATGAIIRATSHDSWRVREMAAKVIARHRVSGAIDAVLALRDDENHRVRAAAERALVAIEKT